MKKWLIILLALVLVTLLALSVFLILYFARLSESDTSAQVSADYDVVIPYAEKNWSAFRAEFDKDALMLTLSCETTMSYESACSYGGNIYADELAPETYLDQARSIAIDVISHCGGTLHVTLQFESTDGKPIFTVCSDGTIWTCWE